MLTVENIKLDTLKKKAIEDLQSLSVNIGNYNSGNVWISREFSLKDDLANLVNSIAKENRKNFFLYVFTSQNIEFVYKKYKSFNLEHIKKSKINSYDKKKTKCIYVGSGRNCKKRLSEHLGITKRSNGTYSLHLRKVLGKTGKVKFGLYLLPLGDDVDSKVMQSLEDSLWKMLSPCFGKLGGK